MKTFPYTPEAAEAFKVLKKTIEESVVCSIDDLVRFDIETDASDFAIAVTQPSWASGGIFPPHSPWA